VRSDLETQPGPHGTRVARGAARRPGFALAVVCALALRLGFGLVAIEGYEPATGDPRDYVRLAENVMAGRGYVLPWDWDAPDGAVGPLRPTALRPPLYPLFLASVFSVAGRSFRAVVIAQALLDTIGCALVGVTATRLFGPTAGVAAAWWAACYPPLWVNVARIWSESLFVMLGEVLLFTLFLRRGSSSPRLAWVVGTIVGLLSLTRPNGIFFLPAALLGSSRGADLRQRSGHALRVLAAFGIVLLPWTLRNYAQFGRVIPLSTMDAVVLRGAYNDDVLHTRKLRGGWSVRTILVELRGVANENEMQDRFRRSAFEWIRRHPRDLPQLAGHRFARFWNPEWVPSEIAFLDSMPWLQTINRFVYYPTIALAAYGAWLLRGRRRELAILASIPVSFSLAAMLTWGDWRIRAPVEPVLVLSAAACFAGGDRRRFD
jgi:Dolichyl-phosphate-mannose-protein mannosyltransferase